MPHLTTRELIPAVTTLALLFALAWAVWVLLRRKKNSREHFAFAALAAYATMFQTVVSALTDKTSLWSSLERFIRSIAGLPDIKPEPPRTVDHLFLLLLATVIGWY